ncbi:MAG: TetR/AcrR family transcriptional regulator [Hyphomicrobiales bacterium]
MPKKLMETREDLRNAMIDAAEAIIVADGVESLTARRLATDMGIAVGTTYNQFRQMDELISEVSARTLAALGREIKAAAGAGGAPEDNIMAYAEAYLEFVSSNPKRWAALFSGSLDPQSEAQHRNNEQIQKLFSFLEGELSELYGGENRDVVKQSARALWAAVHGMLMLASGGRLEVLELDDIHSSVRLLVRYHLAGMAAQPSV